MKIAYFSPLSPIKSGITTYSENNLLPYLKKFSTVDIFIDKTYTPTNESIKNNFSVRSFEKFDDKQYDGIIYHLGNNPSHEYIYNVMLKNPGIVVVHDAYIGDLISYMTIGKGDSKSYIEYMIYCLGDKGRKIAENAIASNNFPNYEYPLLKKVADSSIALMVHSDFAKKVIIQESPHAFIKKINHPTPLKQVETRAKKEDFKISKDTIVISTFGFIARHKRLEVVLRAFAKFTESFPNSKFFIVGSFLEKNYFNEVKNLTKELNISEKVIVRSEYVKDLVPLIQISDAVIQTRFPTAGETSGMVLEIMREGKPVIVSNVGWFSELPDDASIKISINDDEEKSIVNAFTKLVTDRSLNERLGANAIQYIKNEHDPEKIAFEIFDFLTHITNIERTKYVQNLCAQLHEMGITHNDSVYLDNLSKIFHEVLL